MKAATERNDLALIGSTEMGRARYGALPGVAVCLAALLVYGMTMAPDLSWSNYATDGGELVTAAVSLGIPHPPGYPTYVILGKLASLLPMGTVASRLNVLSSASIAAAAGAVTSIIGLQWPAVNYAERAVASRSAAAAGLAFAFAPLVWSQATVAEVYGLNLLFLAAFLWFLFDRRSSWLVGVLLGLSITTHLTSILVIPLALRYTTPRNWSRLGLGLLAGLLPLLMLPIFAQNDSPVMWGDPTTIARWWWLVSGRLYRDNVMGISLSRLTARSGSWVSILLPQFTWAGPLLIAYGFRSKAPTVPAAQKWLLGTSIMYLVCALGYDSTDAIVFLLPALLLLTILLGPGLRTLGWAAFLLPLFSLFLNFGQMDLSKEPGVRPFAEHLLETAPVDAILMTPGDGTIFALWYFQGVEKQRPDLVLVDSNLFAFDWYRHHLNKMYPYLVGLDADDLASFRLLNRANRPYCSVTLELTVPQNRTSDVCDGSVVYE